MNPVYIPVPCSYIVDVDYTYRIGKITIECTPDCNGKFFYDTFDLTLLRKSLNYIKTIKQNGPATIIFDRYGKKTVAKCVNEENNPKKGLIMCLLKHTLSSKQYHEVCSMYEDKKKSTCKHETESAYAILTYIYGKKELDTWLERILSDLQK
jgi:hypothetical protein